MSVIDGFASGEFDRLVSELSPLYRVERELGRGPIGMVYLAHAVDTGAPVALKVLSADVVAMMTDPDRFVRAIERAGKLQHPSLLRTLGAGRTASGTVYFAVAFAEGLTMRDRVERDGPIPADTVAAIGGAIADALAAAHTAGLIHGGITPANLHESDNQACLSDLGVHTGLVESGIPLPRVVEILGSPQYLSPEQVAAGEIDGRSDIYALGASLYELLTGKAPFGGRTTTIVMASVLTDEPTIPVNSSTEIPGRITSAILRAIEKNPDDRWPNAISFARTLLGLSGQQAAVPEPAPTPAKRTGCMPALIAIVTAAAGTWALVHFA